MKVEGSTETLGLLKNMFFKSPNVQHLHRMLQRVSVFIQF